MVTHSCERFALRVFWMSQLAAAARDGVRIVTDGRAWQDLVLSAAYSEEYYRAVQGPGFGRLFGRYGASGMPAEIDVALDDGRGLLSLTEAKALADYTLRRDHVFVFSCKVHDHEASGDWRRHQFYALLASAGRVDAITTRWCFYQGVDVLDPDRFPLVVLSRLEEVIPGILTKLSDPWLCDWLAEALQIEEQERLRGPVLLRDSRRLHRLKGEILRDLEQIQARLSENLWEALCGNHGGGTPEERESALLSNVRRQLELRGIRMVL